MMIINIANWCMFMLLLTPFSVQSHRGDSFHTTRKSAFKYMSNPNSHSFSYSNNSGFSLQPFSNFPSSIPSQSPQKAPSGVSTSVPSNLPSKPLSSKFRSSFTPSTSFSSEESFSTSYHVSYQQSILFSGAKSLYYSSHVSHQQSGTKSSSHSFSYCSTTSLHYSSQVSDLHSGAKSSPHSFFFSAARSLYLSSRVSFEQSFPISTKSILFSIEYRTEIPSFLPTRVVPIIPSLTPSHFSPKVLPPTLPALFPSVGPSIKQPPKSHEPTVKQTDCPSATSTTTTSPVSTKTLSQAPSQCPTSFLPSSPSPTYLTSSISSPACPSSCGPSLAPSPPKLPTVTNLTASPSVAPTPQSKPIIQFSQAINLEVVGGCAALSNDTASQRAIAASMAYSLQVDVSDVSYSGCTSGASTTKRAVNIREKYSKEGISLAGRRVVTGSSRAIELLSANTHIVVPMQQFASYGSSASDAQSLFAALQSHLAAAVSSGNFTKTLKATSIALGATTLAKANFTSLGKTSPLEIVFPPTSSPSQAPSLPFLKQQDTTGKGDIMTLTYEILGPVLGFIAVILALFFLGKICGAVKVVPVTTSQLSEDAIETDPAHLPNDVPVGNRPNLESSFFPVNRLVTPIRDEGRSVEEENLLLFPEAEDFVPPSTEMIRQDSNTISVRQANEMNSVRIDSEVSLITLEADPKVEGTHFRSEEAVSRSHSLSTHSDDVVEMIRCLSALSTDDEAEINKIEEAAVDINRKQGEQFVDDVLHFSSSDDDSEDEREIRIADSAVELGDGDIEAGHIA